MSPTVAQPKLRVAFARAFSIHLEERVRAHLGIPCDVIRAEPARHAFQELPNVLITPHVSGWTEGMLEARARLIAENIRRAARGASPVHLIPASAE